MIVKVYTDTGKKKPVIMLAKVVSQTENGIYHIKYLSPTNETFDGKILFKFEDRVYDIDDESITEFMPDLIGYIQIEDGYIKDEDEDVEYTSDDSKSESENSFTYDNSDEENEEIEIDDYAENYSDYDE